MQVIGLAVQLSQELTEVAAVQLVIIFLSTIHLAGDIQKGHNCVPFFGMKAEHEHATGMMGLVLFALNNSRSVYTVLFLGIESSMSSGFH